MGRSGVILVTAILALTATACSGDDDAGNGDHTTTTSAADKATEARYTAAIVTSLTKSGGAFGDADTNACVAQSYVDAIGLDALQQHATPAQIAAKPNAEPQDFGLEVDDHKLYDGMNDCVDVDALVLANYSQDEPVVECLKGKTTDGQRFSLFRSSNNDQPPDPAADAAVKRALAACTTP